MLVKTSELSGAALDWAVAKCENKLGECTQARNFFELCKMRGGMAFTYGRLYSPSTDWAHGGPIKEREKIGDFWHEDGNWFQCAKPGAEFIQRGPTPLIAVMRCYIASKLGDTVEIPDELVN